MKKSIKLLTLTFLTTATISLPLTFFASSCSNSNNTSITSNIFINSQSPAETKITTSDATPTLFVKASTNSTSELKYDWFVSKNDGLNWTTIENSNTNTYQIPSTELNGIKDSTTWQYKVQISLVNDANINVTSNIYKVTIDPSTSTNNVELIQDLLQTVSVSSDEDISLSVTASSDNAAKSLWYDWYLQKPDGTFNKVQHSTSSSYSLNSSDYTNVKNKTNWKVYAVVYPEGEESSKRTSSTCTIQINPQVNTIVSPLTPTPSTSDPITARDEVSNGLTTIKYDTEKYIADNSVSVLLAVEPNIDYLKEYLQKYINKWKNEDAESSIVSDKYSLNFANSLMQSLDNGNYQVSKYTGGTGWILDYSYDKTNQNLVNYYISTNIHVLDANYRLTFTAYINSWPIAVTATVPINKNTVNDMSVYLSQPQYSETHPDQNTNVLANNPSNLLSDWYKTSITKDNVESNLIPIGAFTDQASPSLSDSYSLQLRYGMVVDFKSYEYKYRFSEDLRRAELIPSYSTKKASDFAVLKLTEDKNKFTTDRPNNPSNSKFNSMYDKITEMFKVETDDAKTTKSSSYISRLNKLLTLTSGENYSSDVVDDLFMFYDYNKDGAKVNTVSIAGFPALYVKNNATKKEDMYVTINSNTMSYSLRDSYNGSARTHIQYYYQGQEYNSLYNWDNNDMLNGMNLMAGSSGSMGVSNTNKIMGIYWGGISNTYGFKGALTRLYSYSDNKSMIKIWLRYIAKNDPNSKLLQLFTALENKNYFTN